MNKAIFSVTAVLLGAAILLTGCGKGDDGAGEAPEITQCIPAGSLYYMTNSISGTIKKTEKFLVDIGAGQQMGFSSDGEGPSMMLAMIEGMLQLGKGFDSEGAAAFVLVNPEAAGMDFVKLIEEKKAQIDAGDGGFEVNYFQATKMLELIAFVIPGKLDTLINGAKPTKEGRLSVITMGMLVGGQKLYAAQKGSFVILSPTPTAVNAILDAKETAAAELSADEIALIKGSELAIHYSMAPYRPLMEKLLTDLSKEMAQNFDKATADALGMYLTMAREFTNQTDAMTMGVKLGDDGVNIDSICVAKPGSAAAKIFEAESSDTGGAKVLNSLPSMPYVMAIGVDGWLDNAALHDAMMELSMSMMGPDSIYKIDDKTKARLIEMQNDMKGAITGVQMVLGAAPKGKGMGNLSYVIKCKDSAKYLGMFPESIELSNKMLAGMEMPPGFPKIAMTYAKDAEKIGDLSVDAMEIELSDLPGTAKEELPAMLKMALGEDKIRVLVATPDTQTLVMTIGGSVEAMKEALKAAGGSGPIPALPGTETAMRNLPPDCSIVMLVNAGNLMEVIRSGMNRVGMPPEMVDGIPTIDCKTPIAFGMKAKGATLHTGLFTAKPLIKDIVVAVLKATQAAAKQWNDEIMDTSGGGSLAPGDF